MFQPKITLISTLLCLWLKVSTAVDIKCEYITVPNSELLNVLGPQYGCNIKSDIPSLDTTISAVEGNHAETKTDIDVTLLTVNEKKIYTIPNLVTKFSKLVYIKITKTPLRTLSQKNLEVYKETLEHLVIRDSNVDVIVKDVFKDFTALKTLDLKHNKIIYLAANVFDSLTTLQYLILQENQCKDLNGIDIGSFTPQSLLQGETLINFLSKVDSSTCRFSNLEMLLAIYQETTVNLDLEVYEAPGVLNLILESQQLKIDKLQSELNDETDAKNVLQESYDKAQEDIDVLESNVSDLTKAKNNCETDKNTLDTDYKNLKVEFDKLKAKIEELEPTAEKCMDVNGTCRFTTGEFGYTCIAHNISVSTAGIEILWTGTHNPPTSKNLNVETLLIRNLDVQFMPGKIGNTFTRLKSITIRNSNLSKLSVGDFLNMDDLKTIQITLNEITTIEAGVFDDLPAMETLDLSENKIKSLPSKIFAMMTTIKSINLSKNQLTTIRADYVPATNVIEYFNATDNQLARVESSFVWRLRLAKTIDFTGNGCSYKLEPTGAFIDFYSFILTKC